MVKLLLQYVADPDFKNDYGVNDVMVASRTIDILQIF
jgi:hypothetical protein